MPNKGSAGVVLHVSRSLFLQNFKVNEKISDLIQEYIIDPSIIRNKIAHGQWSIAFNREHTNVNNDIDLENLKCTDIEKK